MSSSADEAMRSTESFAAVAGVSYPVGATVSAGGVNFCVYSRDATGITLALFDQADDTAPAQSIRLDPDVNRTYHYWHVFVPGLRAGQLYGYYADGPHQPDQGLVFDPLKLLVDPYALSVALPTGYSRAAAAGPGDDTATAAKSVVVDPDAYDWEGDQPLKRDFDDSIIYEMHVRGFTAHPSSGVTPANRGTYAGLIEKIPYLTGLAVTTVELMPVQQFDPQDVPDGLTNYWGYQPVAFFAPHSPYSSRRDPLGPVEEFRDLVKALHQAGIEVILDVVFNHTAEAGMGGPILSLRGLDNLTYYLVDPAAHGTYDDYTGTGNTVNANETIVRRLILDCLRHWVQDMHVDGFRFDLAAVLSRGEDGAPLTDPPILWDIETDPVLAGTKIIAEAWDAAGLYEVTTFVGDRWAVWNGRYRDNLRRFMKGDPGQVRAFADSLMGSALLFQHPERDPTRSINFVTAHDGFTLNDLVSYDTKHNEANGEGNRDGSDTNDSWNCGAEGPTDDPAVDQLRLQQSKNFLTALFVSQGRPMVLMGDEVRRTQHGNNNAYCQDNETSWYDWDLTTGSADLLRFVRGSLDVRQGLSLYTDRRFWGEPGSATVVWHGVELGQPDFSDDSHTLALELSHPDSAEHLHIVFNAYWEPLGFALPDLPAGQVWHRLVDAALQFQELKGSDVILWLTVMGGKREQEDDKAVAVVREIADLAAAANLRVALYPHTGFYVATTADALRVVKKVDRKNVGGTINLCHELMTDQGDQLDATIQAALPHLFLVSINGADRKEKGYSWDRLIQPLGRGNFDVCGFLKKLQAAGYTGPIGLQCYAVKGDAVENLKQSISAWKEYSARLAAPR